MTSDRGRLGAASPCEPGNRLGRQPRRVRRVATRQVYAFDRDETVTARGGRAREWTAVYPTEEGVIRAFVASNYVETGLNVYIKTAP